MEGCKPQLLKFVLERGAGKCHTALAGQRCHSLEYFAFAVFESVRLIRHDTFPFADVQER